MPGQVVAEEANTPQNVVRRLWATPDYPRSRTPPAQQVAPVAQILTGAVPAASVPDANAGGPSTVATGPAEDQAPSPAETVQ